MSLSIVLSAARCAINYYSGRPEPSCCYVGDARCLRALKYAVSDDHLPAGAIDRVHYHGREIIPL